jgi:WD40 repeat protein
VTATVFSVDGSCVVSGSDDGTVRVWSAVDGAALCALGARSAFIGAAVFSANGLLCASAGGDQPIQVRNTRDGSLVRTLPGNTNHVSSLAFSPDSERLASGGGPLDPTVRIWKLNDGTLLQTIVATTNGVMALAWSPDGATLAVGADSIEKTITLWTTNGMLQRTLSGHTNGVTTLAFSPNGEFLASGGRRPENMVRIWRLADGVVTRSFLSTATNNNVECVTFSPDGNYVGYGRSAVSVIKIGNLSSGQDHTLGSGTNPVYSVVFSPDGRTLAATDLNSVQIWTNGSAWNAWGLRETVTQEVVRPSILAYSPNGNLFLCGREDGTLTMSPNVHGAMGQPPLTFTSFNVLTSGTALTTASVQPGTRYTLESSGDMAAWTYLTQAVSLTSTLSLTNLPAPNAPAWFLRAVTPP